MTDNAIKVLIAEDSPTQAVQILGLLTQSGFEAQHAENGRLALEAAPKYLPDIVVTDMQMPEMDGLELLSALNEEFPQLPVVIITAEGSEEIAATALKKGAASYVPKRKLDTDLIPVLDRIMTIWSPGRDSSQLGDCMEQISMTYSIGNDDRHTPTIIAKFQEYLERLGVCDYRGIHQIATALDEAITNGIVHGNLEITSEMRYANDGSGYLDILNERKKTEPYSSRSVRVEFYADREEAQFVVRDEGHGFDPSTVPDATDPENLEKASGRGLLLISAFMDEIRFNDKGNEITMIKRRDTD